MRRLVLLAALLATPLHAAERIPEVLVSAGNLLSDCRPAIDLAAAHHANGLVAEFTGKQVYGGWGYHYILDFPGFPEARTFDAETIRRNREQMRANLAYAAQKGVKVYLHHYNFCAPIAFVKAHPEVNKRAQPTTMMEQQPTIYGDLCWHEPVYRKFLVACWDELFETYPQLGGVIVTYGECNHCPDEDRGEGWKDTARSFITTFNDTLRRHGATPIVRTWWMRRLHVLQRTGQPVLADTFLPKGPLYLMKFSLYDSVTEQPDDEFDQWRRDGFDLACDLMSRGENVGPFYYLNPRFQHARIASLIARDVKVVRLWANDPPSASTTPLFRLNQEALIRYATAFEPYDESVWVRALAQYVGEVEAATVLHAAEDASAVILGLPRVLGLPDEGFNLMGFYYMPPFHGWPGTLGAEDMNPTPEWRQGLTPFRDLITTAVREGYTPDLVERVAAGRPTPFATIDGYVARCERGVAALEGVVQRLKPANPEAAKHVEQLLLRARASALWGRYWNEMLRARLAYEACFRADERAARDAAFRELEQRYDGGVTLLRQVVELLHDKDNLAYGLNLRGEHRAKVLATAADAVQNPPPKPPALPVGQELVANGGFEQVDDTGKPTGWGTGTFAGKPAFAWPPGGHGRGAAVLGDDPVCRGALVQRLPGRFDEGRYRLRLHYRLHDVKATGTLNGALVRLIPRDDQGHDLRQEMLNLGRGTSDGWQSFDREISFPPGSAALEVDLFLWLAAGRVVFDDVSLVRVQ